MINEFLVFSPRFIIHDVGPLCSAALVSWLQKTTSAEVPLSISWETMPVVFFQEGSEVSLGVASFTGGSTYEDLKSKIQNHLDQAH